MLEKTSDIFHMVNDSVFAGIPQKYSEVFLMSVLWGCDYIGGFVVNGDGRHIIGKHRDWGITYKLLKTMKSQP